MACVEYDDGLTVCYRRGVRVLATESAGVRWCFVCRKRVEFTDTCTTDDNPWYEPTWGRTCERGHFDGDLFPGYSRWNP